MLEKNTIITLENNKEFHVLRTLNYNNKNYALITDFKKENHVVLVEEENGSAVISLVDDKKEEELIANMFLKDSLNELKQIGSEDNQNN